MSKKARAIFGNVDKKISEMMRRFRSQGNRSTEMRVRSSLIRAGISGWKLHPKGIMGRPDFYFPSKKLAVFIDGCFWHACKKCYRRPKSRQFYWDKKIEGNRIRDKTINKKLRREGYTVMRFWEHEVKKDLKTIMTKIRAKIS